MAKTTTGKPPTSPEDMLVTDGEIRSWKAMKGTKSAMKTLYGDEWGDEEVRRWIQDKRYEKWQEENAKDDFVTRRYQEYMQAFESATPNDEQMVLAMCSIEQQLEEIRKTLAGGKVTDVKEIQNLSKAQTDLLKEHRQLQDVLGIQRHKRKSERQTARDQILTEIDRAREFMEKELITIIHEDCNIQMGWIKYNFRELPYKCQFTCPRCGGDIIVSGGDPEETKKVLERLRRTDEQRD